MRRLLFLVTAIALVPIHLTGAPGPSTLPKDIAGFSGKVHGTVGEKGEKHSFTLQVTGIVKVWDKNEAPSPSMLVGRTVRVEPRWEQDAEGRWRESPLHVAFIGTLKPGDEIDIEVWNCERDVFAVLELSARQNRVARNALMGEGGTAEGILTTKGDDWIEVKADDGEAERYSVPVGKDGAEIASAVRRLPTANRVRVEWKLDGEPTIVRVSTIAPEKKSGIVEGTIVAKGEEWIDVKPDGGGPVERYMPRWVGGGLERPMLDTLRKMTKTGDRVRVKWQYEERKRVVDIERIQEDHS